MHDLTRRLPAGPPQGPEPAADPIQVLCGPLLCVLRVWSEAEWEALPEPVRPATREHVPGLGWVGAVPSENMN